MDSQWQTYMQGKLDFPMSSHPSKWPWHVLLYISGRKQQPLLIVEVYICKNRLNTFIYGFEVHCYFLNGCKLFLQIHLSISQLESNYFMKFVHLYYLQDSFLEYFVEAYNFMYYSPKHISSWCIGAIEYYPHALYSVVLFMSYQLFLWLCYLCWVSIIALNFMYNSATYTQRQPHTWHTHTQTYLYLSVLDIYKMYRCNNMWVFGIMVSVLWHINYVALACCVFITVLKYVLFVSHAP